MFLIYNLIVSIVEKLLPIVAWFSPKIKCFTTGRLSVIETLQHSLHQNDKTIWFHAASLGEYEQGLPVMESIKKQFPTHKIVLTFFSPSGYEVKKNNTVAHLTVYLPLDTKNNVEKFLQVLNPTMVFFIKYEYWPNYLKALKNKNVSTYLISGIFRNNQPFFKGYGAFYRTALQAFTHFFVQNNSSKSLLQSIGYNNVTVAGDTRFDRVAAILDRDNQLDFVTRFTSNPPLDTQNQPSSNALTIVIGSSWAKDEELLINYINTTCHKVKFIIAPHNIKLDQITLLKTKITKKTILYSQIENKNLSQYDVLIVDTIGLLTKIYSYAHIAYVGGGFGSPGVHNILEPATFGTPVIIGPHYTHFAEATALVHQQGCVSIANQQELNQALDCLIQNSDERLEKGYICKTFIQMNKGATATILNKVIQ